MVKFKRYDVSDSQIKKRCLVYGVGVNDATYMTRYINSEGKEVVCDIFSRWKNMILRCYSSYYHTKQPTYIGCTVCDEWLIFSNFARWMMKQDYVGKQLDKDIIKLDNSEYNPDNCIFVSSSINKMVIGMTTKCIDENIGIRWCNERLKYEAQCHIGKTKRGYFVNKSDAIDFYRRTKSKYVYDIAQQQDEPLRGYLENISKNII